MSFLDKLKKLKFTEDAVITLTYEEGCDVFHYNETEVETALSETMFIDEFVGLLLDYKIGNLISNRWTGNIMQHLREGGFLDDYERQADELDSYWQAYMCETLRDNFYDVELFDHSTEKYDHKRGFTTLTAQVQIPVSKFIETDPHVYGWTAEVETEDGTFVTFK